LQRAINALPYKENERVKVRRSARRGTIQHIEHDPDLVNWISNRPHYIKVLFDDGIVQYCHHSQLKRSKL
jgi:hypothetical protein